MMLGLSACIAGSVLVSSSAYSSVQSGGGNGFGADQSAGCARLRNHVPPGSLVAATVVGLPRPLDFRRLFHLGSVSGRALQFRAVPVAVLLAGSFRAVGA